MVKHFTSETDIKNAWDHVFTALWQRYPNPFSTHVLTEDVVYREVTEDHRLVSRAPPDQDQSASRWAERIFPANLSRSVYIMEDSIVDPTNKSMITFTWNVNHNKLMTVQERCSYQQNQDRPGWTQLRREAWISSGVFGFSRPIQEFGLARFKSNQTKTMKGLEYALSKLHGDIPQRPPRDVVRDPSEKAKDTAMAATEKAKNMASAASAKKSQQFV